jgi:hypothetical protein
MYLPSEQDQRDIEDVKKWMYIDPQDGIPKLKPDTPKEIIKKRERIKKNREVNAIY